jgi:hypothetical protein
MAGKVVSLWCPRCKVNFITRIRWGEEMAKKCPECERDFTPDQQKLSKLCKEQFGVDSELGVME